MMTMYFSPSALGVGQELFIVLPAPEHVVHDFGGDVLRGEKHHHLGQRLLVVLKVHGIDFNADTPTPHRYRLRLDALQKDPF